MDLEKYEISELGGPSEYSRKLTRLINSTFLLDERYLVLKNIGNGVFGTVVSARDALTGEIVVIKKIEKAFESLIDAKQALRALKIMRLLANENIIRIKSLQLPRGKEELKDIYVVMELMETDLGSVIKSSQDLTNEHCQFFLYQILRGLKYMHSAGIVHRNLRPRNLLVNSNCDMKICDFGLALPLLGVNVDDISCFTRWYQAPESLLFCDNYTRAMDIWSVGCIFAEMLLRKPLFPGKDMRHELLLIFNLIGSPSLDDISAIPNPKARRHVTEMQKRPAQDFSALFLNASPLALDLLKKLLTFNPDKRITAEEALMHGYLQDLHDPDDEPTAQPVTLFDFEYERKLLTVRDLKDLMYEEILLYHFSEKQAEYEAAKGEYLATHLSTSPGVPVYHDSGEEV